MWTCGWTLVQQIHTEHIRRTMSSPSLVIRVTVSDGSLSSHWLTDDANKHNFLQTSSIWQQLARNACNKSANTSDKAYANNYIGKISHTANQNISIHMAIYQCALISFHLHLRYLYRWVEQRSLLMTEWPNSLNDYCTHALSNSTKNQKAFTESKPVSRLTIPRT